MTIFDILKDSAYKTEQFTTEAIERLNGRIIEKEDKKVRDTLPLCALPAKKKFV